MPCAATRSYIRSAVGSSTTEELARLGQLRADGTINDEELALAKAQLLGGAQPA